MTVTSSDAYHFWVSKKKQNKTKKTSSICNYLGKGFTMLGKNIFGVLESLVDSSLDN
jgi:hypothetical protein